MNNEYKSFASINSAIPIHFNISNSSWEEYRNLPTTHWHYYFTTIPYYVTLALRTSFLETHNSSPMSYPAPANSITSQNIVWILCLMGSCV